MAEQRAFTGRARRKETRWGVRALDVISRWVITVGGIGYSGIGYKTADVRAVPLSTTSGKPVPAETQYGYSGEYPMSRFLYVYLNYKPGSQLDPLQREFVKYVFSREGQEVVAKDGFLPVTAKTAAAALALVGITK